MQTKTFFGGLLAAALFAATGARATELLTNGDFATGDFTGWTLFTTANGSLGSPPDSQVVPFDLPGPTNAAEFQVGAISGGSPGGTAEGGGIFQSFVVGSNGILHFRANVAEVLQGGGYCGVSFSVLLDGVVRDSFSHCIPDTGPNLAETRDLLHFNKDVGGGSHTITLLVTNPSDSSSFTPHEYLANISATLHGSAPEPQTWGLMVFGFGLAGAAMRRATGRRRSA